MPSKATYLLVMPVLAVIAVAAPAQAPAVHLQWTFKKGDTFYLETVSTAKQTVEVSGRKILLDLGNTLLSRYTVLERTDAAIELEQKIENAKTQGGGLPGLGGMLGAVAGKLKGSVFRFTMTPDGIITKF